MRIVSDGIMIDEQSRILLLKRSNYTPKFPYLWTIPGGRGDPGETPEQVAIREVKEETSLDFTPEKLFSNHQGEHTGEDVDVYKFLGAYTGNINIDPKEADGYAWYTYNETQKLDIAFSHGKTIEKLYKDGILK